jgi:ferrous iron transport protein A
VQSLPASGATFVRLREMGLLPGTTITFVRAAPLGDPLEFKVRGYHLTLRREEADLITVEKG